MSENQINRRRFLKSAGAVTAGIALAAGSTLGSVAASPVQTKLPRWRGFNFLDFLFPKEYSLNQHYLTMDDDFRWMRDFGFDFVRLPMAYAHYLDIDFNKDITPEEVYKIDREKVERIDQFIARAHKFGLHVNLNLHRAPGYCINPGFNEPYNLWVDKEAQEAFYFHWRFWAKRYQNVSSEKISFDLVNEPSFKGDQQDAVKGAVPVEIYREVVRKASAAIRESNPNHLVIADGNRFGLNATPELSDLNVGQSCRGYFPNHMSRFGKWASLPLDGPAPSWPGEYGGKYYDRASLEEFYQPWIDLAKQGVGVHCGECGSWNKTPHDAFLAWFEDVLDILTSHNIGWALWNLRGDFGVIDSNRADVKYEDWYGHKLDGKLMRLLQKY